MLDLPAYLHSLEVLREFVVKSNNPQLRLLPAHGEVINDALGKIDEYLAIRRKLINKVWGKFKKIQKKKLSKLEGNSQMV